MGWLFMDEKASLLNIIDILVRHLDNMSIIEANMQSSHWSLYATLASAFGVFLVGLLNFRASTKMIKCQNEKAYREIITAEKIKAYNYLRDACTEYIGASLNAFYNRFDRISASQENKSLFDTKFNPLLAKLNYDGVVLEMYVDNDIMKPIRHKIVSNFELIKNLNKKENETEVFNNIINLKKELIALLHKVWSDIDSEAHISY
jgi:hypothetical protein